MVDPAALLVLGLSRQQLTTIAGVAGGVAAVLATGAMLAFSVLPAYSQRWTERLGVAEPGRSGPDPTEVVPGRDAPIASPSPRGDTGGGGGVASIEAPTGDAADEGDDPQLDAAVTSPGPEEDGAALDQDDPPVADGGDAPS